MQARSSERVSMGSMQVPMEQTETSSTAPDNGATVHPVPVGIDAPILEVMASMRAMRRLRPDPVPDALLEQLIEAASWAPNANHLQRFSFVVVTDRRQMGRIGEIRLAVCGLYREPFLT